MILVDLNQVLISNLMAQTRGQPDKTTANEDMIRHMVINSLRGFNVKFKTKYGKMVLCSDAGDPWRRDNFPHYKYSRKKGREESSFDWDNIFNIITNIKNEIKENFPYVVMYEAKCEADDIIATLVKYYHQHEDIMIVSGDKDFQQLQKYPNVKQYSPIQKKFIETSNPQEYTFEHILRGDTSDGIPNFLSPDDTFINKIKQKPILKKKLNYWIDTLMKGDDPKTFCNEYHYRNYQRNQRLIDFDYIPDDMEEDIYSTYKKVKANSKTKILPYLINNDLKELIGKIEEF